MTTKHPGKRGIDLLLDPNLNKGTAFSEEERDALGLRGLLPPQVFDQDTQVLRVMSNYAQKTTDLERYIFLTGLQDRNEKLFYRTIADHIDTMMPIIYTPTVGEACKQFARIFRRARGMYISANDRGRVASVMRNWPTRDIAVIVVTDGERILGLGDLGANGMGIPIGKLSLYTACAGIDPARCLPVMLDVGTENPDFLADPVYFGLRQKRLRGAAYDALVDEFIAAVQEVFPGALIQFEDFVTKNAYAILERHRDRVLCFNDDIQGTASVVLAGILAAMRITRGEITRQTFLFLGAGSAATGVAGLLTRAMGEQGLSVAEARKRIWLIDSKGLITRSREHELDEHKRPYAHDHAEMDFFTAVKELSPNAIIGATGRPGTFTRELLEHMSAINERPILFALSNPTSRAECTAAQAYQWSKGKVVFASGSPFDPVEFDGRTYVTGQGNNAYIFPGIGLGSIACGARRITDDMFLAAAKAVAGRVSQERLDAGALYPPLSDLREVSIAIAMDVAEYAYHAELATLPRPADLEAHVRSLIYDVSYDSYS